MDERLERLKILVSASRRLSAPQRLDPTGVRHTLQPIYMGDWRSPRTVTCWVLVGALVLILASCTTNPDSTAPSSAPSQEPTSSADSSGTSLPHQHSGDRAENPVSRLENVKDGATGQGNEFNGSSVDQQGEANETTSSTSMPSMQPDVQRNIVEAIATDLGQPEAAIAIEQWSQNTWPDGCLGLAGPDEFCTMMLVEGWLIHAKSGQQSTMYRTNLNGTVVRRVGE